MRPLFTPEELAELERADAEIEAEFDKEAYLTAGERALSSRIERLACEGKLDDEIRKKREWHRAHYQANKERIKARSRSYYQRHKEKCKERSREYYYAHKAACLALRRAYQCENREKINTRRRDRYKAQKQKEKATCGTGTSTSGKVK